ncbi:hypothetical protein [Marinifilum flexuosum]|uniref:hypothetical protein n=1 Tax=Marinifilum flexuosum TaxID=1117708 RepID=UPI00249464B7|nr:hypothetical protein [Marinifilum flexuosum]
MLRKDDLYWGAIKSKPKAPNSIEFESIITPTPPLWIENSSKMEGPYQILSIKCYKINFDNDVSWFVNIAQFLNDDNEIEQYWISKERKEIFFENMKQGLILTESEKDEAIAKTAKELGLTK